MHLVYRAGVADPAYPVSLSFFFSVSTKIRSPIKFIISMLPTHRKPTLPGEILLEEFLTPLGITQAAFVEYLGGTWTQLKLSTIISGKRAITKEIALDFADALGTSAEFWMELPHEKQVYQ